MSSLHKDVYTQLRKAFDANELRYTKQREHVFSVLMSKRDHPTTEEVFRRAKIAMPTISLATVYNSLEALVQSGLVRHVNFERESTRYCPNLAQHAHFHCKSGDKVYDIDLPEGFLESIKSVLPKSFDADNVSLTFTGIMKP